MAERKITKKEKITMLLGISEVKANPMLVEFLENEYALLEKKASAKSSKVNTENEAIKAMLVEELSKIGTPVTISELMAQSVVVKNYILENGKTLTNPKITAMLKPLVEDKIVVNVKEGKKSLYSVA
jgi:hypothetical protein